MKEYLTDNFGFWNVVPLTDAETDRLQKAFVETFENRNSSDEKTWYSNFNAFAADVFNILSTKAGIGWTSNTHTGNPVPIYAVGAGASEFAGINNNTVIPVRILEAAGYKF